MRQLLVIVLSLGIVAPGIGTWGWLHMQKRQVRKEVKRHILAGMDKEALTLLVFEKAHTDSLLHWHHSREFEYRGEMYDIVSHEVSGDSIYYWCFWDQRESALNRQIDGLMKMMAGHATKDRETVRHLQDFLKNLISPPETHGSDNLSEWSPLTREYPEIHDQCVDNPPTPPPDRLSSTGFVCS